MNISCSLTHGADQIVKPKVNNSTKCSHQTRGSSDRRSRAAKAFAGIRTDSVIKQVKPALHFTTAKHDYSAFTGIKYKEEAILT